MRSILASHRSTKRRSLRLATGAVLGAAAIGTAGAAIAPSQAEAQSAGLINHCWIVADGSLDAGGVATGNDWLSDYDLATDVETVAGAGTSTINIEAVAYHYPSGRLFATDAGQFGEVSLAPANYGDFVPIGPGALGDIDSLSFDSTTGVLWATHRTSANDELIRIDPATGTQTGPTVTIAATTYSGPLNSGGTTVLSDIDDLGINPVTGEFFAIANGAGTLDMLVLVDPMTGATTPIGSPADSGIQDIEGLGFTPFGDLIGTSGSGGLIPNSIVDINKTDGSASLRNDSLTHIDHEAVDCLTNAFISPSIGLEKATNSIDADATTGPFVEADGTVTWTYLITNNGNLPLFDLALTDDIEGAVTCNHPQPLFPGASTTCTLTAAAITTGQYVNVGTVTGTPIDLVGNGYVLDPESDQWLDPSGVPADFTTFDPAAHSPLAIVTATDPSHYFGSDPQIDIEKATNGVDADTPTGPTVTIGGPVAWTYTVTNPGNVAVSDVIVTDDNGTADPADDFVPTYVSGDTNGDNLLDVDETWTYTATGTAVEGQSSNNAAVNGIGPESTNPDGTTTPGTPVADEDPSHHLGTPALVGAVSIEKDTNGVQADAQTDNPTIGEGANITWTYVVSNIGTLDLINVTVADDIEGPVCVISSLMVGQSSTCTLSGVAGDADYRNMGSVTAQPVDEAGDPVGIPVSDADASGYDVAVDTTLAAAVSPAQVPTPAVSPAQDSATATTPTSQLPQTGSSTLALLLVATFMIATGSVLRLVPARRRND